MATHHVVHNVYAGTASELTGPDLDVFGERINGGLCPHRHGQCPLFFRRCNRDDTRPHGPGHINGSQPHSAARTGDQNDLARAHHGAVLQREPGGAVYLQEGCASGKVESGGKMHQLLGPGQQIVGKRPAPDGCKYAIAHGEAGDTIAHGIDNACRFAAGDVGRGGGKLVFACRLKAVHKAGASSLHRHPHLSRTSFREGSFLHHQILSRSELRTHHDSHGVHRMRGAREFSYPVGADGAAARG